MINKCKSFLKINSFPFYRQLEANDCGATCIRMISAFYNKDYSLETVKKACNTTRIGSTVHDIISGANHLGLHAVGLKISLADANKMPLPSILFWQQEHFVILYKTSRKDNKNIYHIADPNFGKIKITEEIFEKSFIGNSNSGVAILLDVTPSFYEKEEDKSSFWEESKIMISIVKSTIATYKNKFIIALILSIIAMVFNWVMPIVFQKIIDNGIGEKNIGIVRILAISQFALFLGYIVSNNFSNILLSRIGYSLGISFLSNYLHKLIRLPIKFFDTKANSDLIQLVDDQENLKVFIIYNVIQSLFTISNLIVFSGILIYYNYKVFMIFLLFGTLSAIWSGFFFKKRRELDYLKFAASSEGKSNIYELVIGMKEIKINSAQGNRVAQIEKTQNKINKFHLKNLFLTYYSNLGVSSFDKLKDIVIVVFGASLVISGHMTIGVLMTISYLLGQLSTPFSNLLQFARDFQSAKLSFNRLFEIQKEMDENNENKSLPPEKITDGIIFENASFKYLGSFNSYVLQNITIRIPKGKVTAIVGVSGSGKTTLLKLLLSFYYPQEGDIYLDGIKMSTINSDEWRKRCGVVMQDGYMFSGTIIDNIAIADEKPDLEKLKMAAKIACINNFIESLPMGYNTKIGNTGIDLSGGQKQRLLIARAVYRNPEFIFFDEATSFLDTTNEAKIMKNLKSFYQEKTVIIIAHRLSTVKDADNIIVLDNGHVVENGVHDELIENRGEYYKLIKNQLELDKPSVDA